MHVHNVELWTFNRIVLACFHLSQNGLRNVRLFMRYFQDTDLLRECYIDGGTDLRHQLRVPKYHLWQAHSRRQEEGRRSFTDLQLKQVCSRARTPNEHFWGKHQFPGGSEAIEELAETIRNLRIQHGFAGRWRRRRSAPVHQFVVAKALAEVLVQKCRGRKNGRTTDGLSDLLLEFVMEHPNNCVKIPKSVDKIGKRVENALVNWRRPGTSKRFRLDGKVYSLQWEQGPSVGGGRSRILHWLKKE